MEWTECMTTLKLLLAVVCLVPTKEITTSVTFRARWRPIAWKSSKTGPETTSVKTELLICIHALLLNSRAQVSKGRGSLCRDKILWLMRGASKLVLGKAAVYSRLIQWGRAEIHHFSWVVFHRKVDWRVHLATSIADLTPAVCGITSFLCIKTWSNHERLAGDKGLRVWMPHHLYFISTGTAIFTAFLWWVLVTASGFKWKERPHFEGREALWGNSLLILHAATFISTAQHLILLRPISR